MSEGLIRRLIIYCLIIFSFIFQANATDPFSRNIGFENGNFDGWTGYNWVYSLVHPEITTDEQLVSLPTLRRQVIMSDTTAYDPFTGNALKIIPKGYHYSARLGVTTDSLLDVSPRCWRQSLRYSMTVDSSNALLVLKYACVLQYSTSHTPIEESRFRLRLLKQNGDSIPTCANFDSYNSSGNYDSFHTYTYTTNEVYTTKWKDWTTVGANLSDFIGQTITIEFMSADCTSNYHFGYAYVIAETHPMTITTKYCTGSTGTELTAPAGFKDYSWTDSTGKVVGTSQVYNPLNPDNGATYTCKLISETGCEVVLTTVIAPYKPNADFSFERIDCNKTTNTVAFETSNPVKQASSEYKWDFGDGTTSTEQNPTHIFRTSGVHTVNMVVHNPPSLCTYSISQTVETFYAPLVGITGDTTYCPGYTTVLKAHGAYGYRWSNKSTADSLVVGKDTTVWMIGYSSNGCHTDTIRYNVKVEPDWAFTPGGKESFCKGDSTVLSASGALNYKWDTGENTSSITVKTTGQHTVTGTNSRGCEKKLVFNVKEDPLINVDFTASASTIDVRHNELTCSIPSENGVVYNWDMGDGLTETGSTIVHTYKLTNTFYQFPVTLTATNEDGCIYSSVKTVDVVLFVTNVFTPNNDGVNDKFMPGVDIPDYELQVFDRNGLLLYKGNTGWDGRFNGKWMDQDTYFYLIQYRDKDQKLVSLKGYLTLKK